MSSPATRVCLAIETATPVCAAAVGTAAGVLAARVAGRDRRHVEVLAPTIADLLAEAGVGFHDVERVAVDVGPGLFTGMRVGIATAQALGLALGVGVVPVGSLQALAHAHRHRPGRVAAVVDARRGEVFSAVARAGELVRSPVCHPPAALAAELAELAERSGPVVAVGDGAERHRAGLEAAGVEVVGGDVDVEAVLALGIAGRPLDPAAVEADYRREADARANFAVLAAGSG